MFALVYIALIGWLPVALALFKALPPHRAAAICYALAWMFLPQFAIGLPALPDYSKYSAMAVGVLAGSLLFHPNDWKGLKFHPVDLAVIFWIVVAIPTSVTNGLGVMDGISLGLERVLTYGVVWLIGRVHFRTLEHLRELVLVLFLAGVLYAPFLGLEILISPQLHRMVYGFHAFSDFSQAMRGGGYRPMAFMQHGLMAAMWTSTSVLAGFALILSSWRRERLRKVAVFLPVLVVGMLGLLVMSRSKGALMLTLGGIAILLLPGAGWRRLAIVVMALVPIGYMVTRGTGTWDGQNVVRMAEQLVGVDRAGSLSYRMYNETLLAEKAMERKLFGWGRYQRSFVRDEEGRIISVPDGMWILYLGQNGVVGLTAITFLILFPVFVFFRLVPLKELKRPSNRLLMVLPLYIALSMIDNLLNDMFTPMVFLAGAAIVGMWIRGLPAEGADRVAAMVSRMEVWRPRAL